MAHSLSAMDRDWTCLRTIPLIGNNPVGHGRQQSPFPTPALNSAANAEEASDRVCSFLCAQEHDWAVKIIFRGLWCLSNKCRTNKLMLSGVTDWQC